jgi:hypothetical protein
MKRYSKEEKARRLEDWKRKKPVGLCEGERNKPADLQQMDKKKEVPGFVQIPQAAGMGITAERNEILIEKRGMKIHLPPGITAEELCAVIKSLGGSCMTPDLDRLRIFIRPGHTDLRKAVNGLTVLIQEGMRGSRSAGTCMCFATGGRNC